MVRRYSSRIATIICITVATLSVSSAFAATVTKISDDAFASLRAATPAKRIVLDKLPLYDNKRSIIDLEEFHVWTPDGKVAIHNGSEVKYVAPQPMRFFRGSVNGDPESFAYFSIDLKTGVIGGLVDTRDRRYAVTVARRPRRAGAPTLAPADDQLDYFLTTADENDTVPHDQLTWECAVDKKRIPVFERPIQATGKDGLPIKAHGITGTQSYSITLEIQTDFEYYENSGVVPNPTTAQTYATNLVGALSTIYNRDLKTNVNLTLINLWTTAADPWTATDPGTGLDQLGDYYNNVFSGGGFPHGPRTTSNVAMLSGKEVAAGIAWTGVACQNDFFDNPSWGGTYSWNGGIGRLFGTTTYGSIPNPDGTNSEGTLYGMPAGIQNYWPLGQLSHELGHNMGSPHTNCMTISSLEFTASGFTDGTVDGPATRYVDHCLGNDSGCFSGTSNLAGSQTAFKGTIMSYCHNVFGGGGVPQSRFTFGVTGQPSQHVYDDYMLRSAGPMTKGGPFNIVNGVGVFTISAITAPASVPPSSTGNAASITAIGGATYIWTITNGTITGGQGTNAILFTAGGSGTTTVRVNAFNSTRCGVTDSKVITIGGAVPAAPANVVATATTTTNVNIIWTSAAGATSYNVYRTTNGTTTAYTQIATGVVTLSYSDPTATPTLGYLYKVRGVNASGQSADSNVDYAITFFFTDPTLTVGSTPIKAVHITQLQTAVNLVRVAAGIGPSSFSTITAGSTVVLAFHISNELRQFLDFARINSNVGKPTFTYSRPTLTAGTTTIEAVDINELRLAVQ